MRKTTILVLIAISILSIIIISDVEFYNMTKSYKDTSENKIKQFNLEGLNLISDCVQFQTLNSLTKCKLMVLNLKTQCEQYEYSSTDICNDSRINQFLDTIDFKINTTKNQDANASR